jgi:hypothetical protein
MPGLQASARLLSESWMRTNPARADHWIARGAAHSTHNVVISLASPTEVEELECWQLRDRLFESASAPVLGPELPGD